ncbi:hypothetical protein OAT84_01540 [Gammaproteobacteria bacterium]|nr:hypothetical protein [Gammaproteobacteria bacterium]
MNRLLTTFLITALCSTLLGFISYQFALTSYEITLGLLSLLCSYYTISSLIEMYYLYQHPFNVMIKPLITPWLQSLSLSQRLALVGKQYVLCLNLSGHAIENTLVPNLKQAFNFKHKHCEVNGFYQEYGALVIEIIHPKNDVIAIHQLWQELKKAGIQFKYCNLLLSGAQIDQFDEHIENEWPLLVPIMHKASQLHVILYEKELHHHLYYACEYNACAIPWFNYDPMAPLNVSRHHLSLSYEQLIQSLYKHINDLCMISPVEHGARKKIFLLPKRLSVLKLSCLNVLECNQKLKLNIKGLGLALFHIIPPSIKHSRWNIYQRLQQSMIILSVVIIWQLVVNQNTIQSLNQEFDSYHDHEVLSAILSHNTNQPHRLKNHIKRHKDYHFKHINPQTQTLLDWLILKHKAQPLPDKIITKIAKYTQLKENGLQHKTLQLWAHVVKSQNPPSIDLLAKAFPLPEITTLCHAYPSPSTCKKTVTLAIKQQQLLNKLEQVYHTLLPLDQHDLKHNIRQLKYLRANPSEIAKNVRHTLDLISSEHSNIKDNPEYLAKIEKIESISELLRSPQGLALLKVIEVIYLQLDQVHTPNDALTLLSHASVLSDHPIQQFQIIQKHLSPAQQSWLDQYVQTHIDHCIKLANQEIDTHWMQVSDQLRKISVLYPFNPNGEDCPTEYFTQLFSPNGTMSQLESVIAPFIENTSDGINIQHSFTNLAITPSMIRVLMYAKILQAAVHIDQKHIQASVTIRPEKINFPLTELNLVINNKSAVLSAQKLTKINWHPNMSIALDCMLADGSRFTLSKSGPWGLLRMLTELKTNNRFSLQPQNHQWVVPLEIKSSSGLNILTANLFNLPKLDNMQ